MTRRQVQGTRGSSGSMTKRAPPSRAGFEVHVHSKVAFSGFSTNERARQSAAEEPNLRIWPGNTSYDQKIPKSPNLTTELQENFRFTSNYVCVFAFIFASTSLFKQHEGADSQFNSRVNNLLLPSRGAGWISPDVGGVLALGLASRRIYPQALASPCLSTWCFGGKSV